MTRYADRASHDRTMPWTLALAAALSLAVLAPVLADPPKDVYEPDDWPRNGRHFILARKQLHNIHTSNDVDWVKFYCATDYVYEIYTDQLGTNADTVLDIYHELPDGTLTNVFGDIDDRGKGTNKIGICAGEIAVLEHPDPGIYYAKVWSTNGFGDDTDYDLMVWVPAAPDGVLVALAVDKMNPNRAPPGAMAIVDGVHTQVFGAANTVEFTGLAPGVHTIQVPIVPGYRGDEDPELPDQATNLNSYLYGDPKYIDVSTTAWQIAVFQFVPYVQVEGVVRDKWTGARVCGAKVEFTALNGIISGLTYDGYPNNASYESNWYSGADGRLPANVWLPAADWSLNLCRVGYSNKVMTSVITGAMPGDVVNLGGVLLSPADTNGNGLADDWEAKYFPGGGVTATNDTDKDGLDDWSEYVCGTDPTNSGSCFSIEACNSEHSFTLAWSSVPGRTYDVQIATNVSSGQWPLNSGELLATNDQTVMSWTDTNTVNCVGKYYRVRVVRP